MNSSHSDHIGHVDLNLDTRTYSATCSCGWNSTPSHYRDQADFDRAVHYLAATEPASA